MAAKFLHLSLYTLRPGTSEVSVKGCLTFSAKCHYEVFMCWLLSISFYDDDTLCKMRNKMVCLGRILCHILYSAYQSFHH